MNGLRKDNYSEPIVVPEKLFDVIANMDSTIEVEEGPEEKKRIQRKRGAAR